MTSRTTTSEPVPPSCPSLLYDVTWTLHRLQWPSNSKSSLAGSLLSRSQQRNRAKQLQEFLYIEDAGSEADNAFDERVGVIREVRWELLDDLRDAEESSDGEEAGRRGRGGERVGTGLNLTFVYEVMRYKVMLYGAGSEILPSSSASNTRSAERSAMPLLLAKAPAALCQRLFTFFSETFSIGVVSLQLPEIFLHNTLEAYLMKLYGSVASLSAEPRATFLSATLQDLKIVLSFKPPVAPHLRTLDVNIPAETVCSLLEATVAQNSQIISVLAAHLERLTAMRIHVPSDDRQRDGQAEEVMQISKITCNAFAISGDGRLKIQDKACNAAEIQNRGHVVREANDMLLGRLLVYAVRPEA